MSNQLLPKVVMIGGGTGTYVVGSGLKKHPVDLTAIVTVADSGGSTGRLRDEFGFLPVGDLRQALAALAVDEKDAWIRNMLLYRFNSGTGLSGHNLGNLLLTALQDMTGSTATAVEVAAQIFRLKGAIYPITTSDIQLMIEYEDGTIVEGEHHLDESTHHGKKIVALQTKPIAKIYSKAKIAIEQADYIVIGPGDLYGSIMPNLVIDGVTEAFANTHSKLVYNANLMSKYAQTHQMSITDHIQVIESQTQKKFDVVLINNQPIPDEIVAYYASENEFPLKDDMDESRYTVLRANLLADEIIQPITGDSVKRSYLRHDSDKIADELMSIIGEL